MIKSTKNNDMKSYAEKLKEYTYYSYISSIVWILSGVILAVLLITDIKLPIISLMVFLVSCGIDLYFSHKKKQLGVEEGIKIMEQPKYRFADLHLQSDKNYTDINDTIVGFLFDRDIIVPSDIQIRLEDIINNMLAEHFAETWQVLYPYDFEVSISMEMNTRTNKVIISTYIVNADDLNLHTEIDTDTLDDYGRTKKYFFNELACIVLNRIGQLQKAANVKGWLAS